MASLAKFTPEDLRLARKAKFKKKRPKKPKSNTINAMETFVAKYNDWVHELKRAASDAKKIDSIKSQLRKI